MSSRPVSWWPAATFAVTLFSSVLFQGFEVSWFGAVQVALLGWTLHVVWRGAAAGWQVPRSALALIVTGFWLWLALSIVWSPVPYISIFDFWWTGTLPLVFWLYLLTPDREPLRRSVIGAALLLGVALAGYGVVQHYLFGRAPRSLFLNINSHAALLNFVALPLAAALLVHWRESVARRSLLAAALFLIVFAVALTLGRGANGTLLLGLSIVFVAAYRRVPGTALLSVLAVVVGAFALVAATRDLVFATRFAEMAEPLAVSSMRVRFEIWAATWRMIQDAPFWGTGLGMFSLLYPAYRFSTEDSAGFLVHNEYLQLWLETGLPGLLLFLALLAAAARAGWRALRRAGSDTARRLEAAGLTAGLTAVSVHSLVDFNFHVLTILILFGAALARLQELALSDSIRLRLPERVSVRGFRMAAALLLLFPFLYFATTALAVREADRARELAQQGELDQADQAYRNAYRLYPTSDNVLVNHADLYRQVLIQLPRAKADERRSFFGQARDMLDRAEQLNPLRPLTWTVRGQLFAENGDLAGADGDRHTRAAFARALEINPRYHPGRVAYARYLLARGDAAGARQVLEQGMNQHYFESEEIVPYFDLTARQRVAAGDRAGAAALGQRIERALLNSGWMRVPRPEDAAPLVPRVTGSVFAN